MQTHLPRYVNHREKFLRSAAALNWRLESLQQIEKSPWDENLFTDFLFSNKKRKRLLISISGTHGIEGYLGSDVQSKILTSGILNQESNFDVLFVHALNPFGMAWYTRTNSANVDLNRNANLNFDKANADYFHFQNWIHSPNGWRRKLEFSKLLLKVFVQGYEKMHRGLALGQFTDPSGLFYGGSQLQPELKKLFEYLKAFANSYENISVLDLHTGLGSFEKESLILDGNREDEAEHFEKILNAKMIDCRTEPNFYICHGQLSDGIRNIFPQDSVYYIYQEFGTVGSYQISDALIDSSQALTKKMLFSDRLAEQMLNCFYPSSDQWRQSCVNKGFERFRQIYFQS